MQKKIPAARMELSPCWIWQADHSLPISVVRYNQVVTTFSEVLYSILMCDRQNY